MLEILHKMETLVARMEMTDMIWLELSIDRAPSPKQFQHNDIISKININETIKERTQSRSLPYPETSHYISLLHLFPLPTFPLTPSNMIHSNISLS